MFQYNEDWNIYFWVHSWSCDFLFVLDFELFGLEFLIHLFQFFEKLKFTSKVESQRKMWMTFDYLVCIYLWFSILVVKQSEKELGTLFMYQSIINKVISYKYLSLTFTIFDSLKSESVRPLYGTLFMVRIALFWR